MTETDPIERLKQTGRNDPCPCGSGRKYKKCHLREDQEAEHKLQLEQEEERAAAAVEQSEDESRPGRETQAKPRGGPGQAPIRAEVSKQSVRPRRAQRSK